RACAPTAHFARVKTGSAAELDRSKWGASSASNQSKEVPHGPYSITWSEIRVCMATGEIAGEAQPRPRGRCEIGRIDSDGEVLAFTAISDGAEPILPAARDSRRIEWCHIKLNPGGGEIDANPVDESAALLRYREPFTTVRYAWENLDRLVRVTLLPKVTVKESA